MQELVELAAPFGHIVQSKLNVGPNRNQAFIEFTDQALAVQMVNYFATSAEPAKVSSGRQCERILADAANWAVFTCHRQVVVLPSLAHWLHTNLARSQGVVTYLAGAGKDSVPPVLDS